MLSRPQQILLKRAQAEAALPDPDYRSAIATISGMADCRSSKDPRLTDRHVDNLLSYLEAIHWRQVDAGTLQASFKSNAIFRQRGYWAAKNTAASTSRDRYVDRSVAREVADLERQLQELGCGLRYLEAIRANMQRGGKPFSQVKYAGALKRTLAAKQRPANCPF
ncbi:MAG: hypothetical protein ABSE16_21365 [Verrucomicrobiota bacterium]|jgi:hypothetical protein